MAKYPNISLLTVIEDYIDFSGHEGELDEPWLLKQANDACERLITDQQYVHKIVVLDVVDYKAEAPSDFKYVTQAAYRIAPEAPCLREEISQLTQKVLGTECELEININCPQCHKSSCDCGQEAIEVDVNRIYESAHPEMFTRYMDHFYKSGGNTGRGTSSYYHPDFMLMRKTSNSFFNVPYHIDNCLNLRVDSQVEYDIQLPFFIVNFQEGEILLSYMGVPLDENGYRMIPNVEIVFQAINYYIEERMAFRRYRQTRAPQDRIFWQEMVQMKEKMIKRARTQLQTPSEDEWWQFVQNHWTKIIPYYKWESNLNRAQRDQFMYQDQTKNPKGYLGTNKRGNFY